MIKQELSGSQSEAVAIDLLLEEVLRENADNPVDNNLISLVRQYNCNDISGDLRRKIRDLKERLNAGKDPPFTRDTRIHAHFIRFLCSSRTVVNCIIFSVP